MTKIGAIIAAGGIGKRLGKPQPKALIKIKSKAMFLYSLSVFQSLKDVKYVVLVTPVGWGERFANEIKSIKLEMPYAIVDGGPQRQDSVRIGLRAMPEDAEYVLIHDAARPFIIPSQIKELIKLVKRDGSATMALKIKDTLRICYEEKSVYLGKMVDRENLWALGTPQGFRRSEILKAHEKALKNNKEVTDDTMLIPKNSKVSVLESDYLNFKITYPTDINFAELLLPMWKKRLEK